jgi:hypothetical protein
MEIGMKVQIITLMNNTVSGTVTGISDEGVHIDGAWFVPLDKILCFIPL